MDEEGVNPPDWSTKSYEDRASHILRFHYVRLYKQLQDPVTVASALYSSKIINLTTFNSVECTGQQSESRAVLLKAVRNAVTMNYRNLKYFIDALEKAEYEDLSLKLLEDYRKYH